jgi:endogenous inhibitor of DNA gyrase (YacG/DUF329 family)
MTCLHCGAPVPADLAEVGIPYCSGVCARWHGVELEDGHTRIHAIRRLIGQSGPCPRCGEVL